VVVAFFERLIGERLGRGESALSVGRALGLARETALGIGRAPIHRGTISILREYLRKLPAT
jgi:hypothetical protein